MCLFFISIQIDIAVNLLFNLSYLSVIANIIYDLDQDLDLRVNNYCPWGYNYSIMLQNYCSDLLFQYL